MMNRGFTLVELLGVIVILSLIAIFVFPSVINTIKENDKSDEYKIAMVENAAKLYIRDNGLSKTNRTICIGELVNGKYLTDLDIKENRVIITYTNGVASYSLDSDNSCN